MKNHLSKIIILVIVIGSIINIRGLINMFSKGNDTGGLILANVDTNNLAYKSDVPYKIYQESVVYDGMTLTELGALLESNLNSDLKGQGKTIAKLSLDNGVDPIVATSIILLETGCKWSCSYLVKHDNNVGGMRGNGSYLSFKTLDDGINAFIKNLSVNYYKQGLNTPEKMNKKYAASSKWAEKVNNYVKLINSKKVKKSTTTNTNNNGESTKVN